MSFWIATAATAESFKLIKKRTEDIICRLETGISSEVNLNFRICSKLMETLNSRTDYQRTKYSVALQKLNLIKPTDLALDKSKQN